MSDDAQAIRTWWRTSIIDMEPGKIAFRDHPIQDLIGNVTFPHMIWLMTRGALPSPAQAALFEAALGRRRPWAASAIHCCGAYGGNLRAWA